MDNLIKLKEKIDVLGIPVSLLSLDHFDEFISSKPANRSLIVTFVNPWACALGRQYPEFIETLNAFDIVACDGIGMVRAARASGIHTIKRESFDYTSIAGTIFQWASKNGQALGLVGGKPGVANRAATILTKKHPGLKIAGCFSGFGKDPADAQHFFRENQTALVVCGMGAPLQEEFLIQLVTNGWLGVGFTCGGFLDQVITGKSYYPRWVDRFEIRFLYRLAKEPRRLWRRYLVDYQVFLKRYGTLQWQLLKSKVRLHRSSGKNK